MKSIRLLFPQIPYISNLVISPVKINIPKTRRRKKGAISRRCPLLEQTPRAVKEGAQVRPRGAATRKVEDTAGCDGYQLAIRGPAPPPPQESVDSDDGWRRARRNAHVSDSWM